MISSFDQALTYLFSHIPKNEVRKFPGEAGVSRMRALVKELDNPQEKYEVIHIAGTSGKGSTATLISTGLVGQGFNVGLQVSPHLLDIRERIQINNTSIEKGKFVKYLQQIIPAIDKVSKMEWGEVTYFEILVALAYYSFWKEKVDYAVIETGMGGLYDGTNVITNPHKIAVITKIGLDHVSVLGNTVEQIAVQKAGIIHKGNTVIVNEQKKSVLEVFEKKIKQVQATRIQVVGEERQILSITEKGTVYKDKKRDEEVSLSLIGEHQAENAQIAREAIFAVSEQDGWVVEKATLQESFQSVRMPGRVDIIKRQHSKFVIDGAHNVQKMEAFLKTLTTLYPQEKQVFLIAFKHGKDIHSMIQMIEKYAEKIILTSFWVDTQDMLNISEPIEIIQEYIKNTPVITFKDPKEALVYALSLEQRIVVTGSLYFSSEVYTLLSQIEGNRAD